MKPYATLKIALASDHAGYNLKLKVIDFLHQQGAQTYDFGCYSTESCDYPDYAHPLATAVEAGEYDFGITICSTGNGICMTANKHQGIRAALCWEVRLAELARGHNNANVLGLPANFVSEEKALDIVNAFFTSDFEGGRHERRVDKMRCGGSVQ
ncbi:MAG: ribose 5-phosphate isomerase B [Paludibacter sp.]|nr:ribose 5-phosphate isomerase B [Bacteroidales bacterium]MCM1069695.1 ribose 5-phosphate isomerase B [Prevotella sp.]MCM1354397.1 ribose 5-phosphate isomerase B [Bacteroides sp.]MCM1441944.1 ribose 5-phosphate isomerase B [Muribaculum sp.]MCM1482618.1 ribose 5-phosphate isomerase B [Paludibacter sp.]